MINLTEKHKQQLKNKGIAIDKVQNQIEIFKEGIPFVNLVNSATIGNGIMKVSEEERENLIEYFKKQRNELNMLKFVPASGAATRMFNHSLPFLRGLTP